MGMAGDETYLMTTDDIKEVFGSNNPRFFRSKPSENGSMLNYIKISLLWDEFHESFDPSQYMRSITLLILLLGVIDDIIKADHRILA